MARRQRKRKGDAKDAGPAAMRRPRRQITPWRERARHVLLRLRDFARDRDEATIEAHLRQVFGDEAGEVPVHDLQRAFDDYVCAKGSAGEDRALVEAFAEETPELQAEERAQLPTWVVERTRRVYLLDRCHRDRMDLWDPIRGGRAVIHLIEKMPPARAASLGRGIVVIVTSAPWGQRRVALGQVEIYEDDDALEMFRSQVRDEDRVWHDLPPPAPLA